MNWWVWGRYEDGYDHGPWRKLRGPYASREEAKQLGKPDAFEAYVPTSHWYVFGVGRISLEVERMAPNDWPYSKEELAILKDQLRPDLHDGTRTSRRNDVVVSVPARGRAVHDGALDEANFFSDRKRR